jgi:hypothetical protein
MIPFRLGALILCCLHVSTIAKEQSRDGAMEVKWFDLDEEGDEVDEVDIMKRGSSSRTVRRRSSRCVISQMALRHPQIRNHGANV